MINFINNLLKEFKTEFSYTRTFECFVIIVIGLLIRTDKEGITSIVRVFLSDDSLYRGLLGFYHSRAYDVRLLLIHWCRILSKTAPVRKIGGRTILIGDGSKRPKAGRKIPLVKSLKQSSQNNNKRESFMGHFFGLVGVLAGLSDNVQCIPIFLSIQEGYHLVEEWLGLEPLGHINRIVTDAISATYQFGPSWLVLDRFFLSRKMLRFLNDNDLDHNLDVIIRAKRNVIAYKDPPAVKHRKRGRPRKHGESVKIFDLFEDKGLFKTVKTPYYGEIKKVSYYYLDLLWGQGLYQKLRFVLSEVDSVRSVFVTTDLKADPVDVITAYTYRFKIEQCFKDLIHIFGGMAYRFWSSAVPKCYKSVSLEESWDKIKSQKKKDKILKAVRAIHSFTACSIIAMGICQLLCLNFGSFEWKERPYKRTCRIKHFSLSEMRLYLQMHLLALLHEKPEMTITKIILKVYSPFQL